MPVGRGNVSICPKASHHHRTGEGWAAQTLRLSGPVERRNGFVIELERDAGGPHRGLVHHSFFR